MEEPQDIQAPEATEERKEITFFIKYGEETKKGFSAFDHGCEHKLLVVGLVDSVATLRAVFLFTFLQSTDLCFQIFAEKFPEAADEEFTFLVKDRQFGVVHKVALCKKWSVLGSLRWKLETTKFTKELWWRPSSQVCLSQAVPKYFLLEKKNKRDLEDSKKQSSEGEQGKRQKVAEKPAFIRNLEDDGKRWVQLRGLPWEVTKEEIKIFFDGVSYLEDSIHIITNAQGQATGDAFVQFVDDENLHKAEERNKNNIGSRYIEVYRVTQEIKDRAVARSRPWNPSGRDGMANGPVSPSSQVVKLRGLPYSATDAEVKEFLLQGLEAAGILAIHMASDHMGRASGDAYVECVTDADVEQALKLNKKNLGRRYVDVMKSSVGEMTQAMAGRGGLVGGFGGHPPPLNPNALIVKMRGLPFSCTEQDIREFFKNIHLGPTKALLQKQDFC